MAKPTPGGCGSSFSRSSADLGAGLRRWHGCDVEGGEAFEIVAGEGAFKRRTLRSLTVVG